MHVFYKKYKHISLYWAYFDYLIILSFETCESSAFLRVYQKYKNIFLVNGVLYDRSVKDHYTELTEREEKDYARVVQSSQTSVFPANSGE